MHVAAGDPLDQNEWGGRQVLADRLYTHSVARDILAPSVSRPAACTP